MRDLKAADPGLKLQMPDGFSDPNSNGAVANGAYISVAGGEPPNKLTGRGATFVQKFRKQIGETPNRYAAYGAQAMEVMLSAVAEGGGERAATTQGIFGLMITNGILGTFTINATGDTNLPLVTIYKQKSKLLVPVKTITPSTSLIG
jgi:branched-chain amino acid transport system substrate-binding protein